MTVGSRGDAVRRAQFWLRIISRSNSAIPTITADALPVPATERPVRFPAVPACLWTASSPCYLEQGCQKCTPISPTASSGPVSARALIPARRCRGSTRRSVKEDAVLSVSLSAYCPISQIKFDGVFGRATEAGRARLRR